MGTDEETIRTLAGVQPVLGRRGEANGEGLCLGPQLRVVARAGVGFDRVDVPAATKHNVVVTITPTANHAAVAEHTLALMFAVARSVVLNDRVLRSGQWIRRTLRPLPGRTIGLIGLGRIAAARPRGASAWG